MHKKSSLTIILLMLAVSAISSTLSSAKSAPTTSVYVDPETYTVSGVNRPFTINITVSEVTSLWGWEISLFYNSTHLNGTDVGEGPFLKTVGETFFWIVNLTDNYNATHGYIRAFCHLTNVIPGPDGNGQIANITFKSKDTGNSTLDLTDTKLKKSDGEYMPHETLDGTIIVELGRKLGDLGGPVGYVPTFFAFDGKVDAWDLALFIQCYKGLGPN